MTAAFPWRVRRLVSAAVVVALLGLLAVIVAPPTASGLSPKRSLTVVVGIDSLTAGAGGTSYRPALAAALSDALGIPARPEWIAADPASFQDALGSGAFSKTPSVHVVAELPWSHPLRRDSWFGRGLYTEGADKGGAWQLSPAFAGTRDIARLAIVFECGSADAGFRWRLADSDVGENVECSTRPKAVPVEVERAWSPSLVSPAPTVVVDQIRGSLMFLAVRLASSRPHIDVVNLAIGGTKATDWAKLNPATVTDLMRLIAPDAFLFNAGMNDRQENPAEFGAAFDQIVGEMRGATSMPCMLIRPNDARGLNQRLNAFGKIISDTAARSGCDYLDDRSVIGSFLQADAAGYMFPDGVHPREVANTLRGRAYARRLVTILGLDR